MTGRRVLDKTEAVDQVDPSPVLPKPAVAAPAAATYRVLGESRGYFYRGSIHTLPSPGHEIGAVEPQMISILDGLAEAGVLRKLEFTPKDHTV